MFFMDFCYHKITSSILYISLFLIVAFLVLVMKINSTKVLACHTIIRVHVGHLQKSNLCKTRKFSAMKISQYMVPYMMIPYRWYISRGKIFANFAFKKIIHRKQNFIWFTPYFWPIRENLTPRNIPSTLYTYPMRLWYSVITLSSSSSHYDDLYDNLANLLCVLGYFGGTKFMFFSQN